ncbi:CDP-alcohol phosphatidyltransferase family protein [Thermococcus aggregans]|uniref:Archaetidylinositol phosphate synthase n=1 Tax=Thermococcus aggregans TaxID=110163 RepID=A0A9E7MWQ4_THEAG|nr:archaetidylinositol phosphate synthase [Thermococcus aggregans]USS40207.1 CDP-alcohol phosphatidyltransferase family protein [Thermococcus aggregans]
MLNRYRANVKTYLESIAKPLVKLGITPNQLTFLGLLISLSGAYFFAQGSQRIATLILLLGSLIDALDGTLARLTGKTSRFGAFLDSTFDRISDGAIFFGIAYGGLAKWEIATIALIGSYLVSYERCRAELAGSGTLAVGIAERAERLLIIIITAIFNRVDIGVYAVAILAWITAFQRLWEAKKRLS